MKRLIRVVSAMIKVFAIIYIIDVAVYKFQGKLIHVKHGHVDNYVFYTKLQTVGDILHNLEIVLEDDDEINFEDEVLTYDGMEINIDLIRKSVEILSEIDEYSSSKQLSYDVPLFREAVIVAGQNRVIESTFRSVFKNGEVISRDLIKTEVTQELVNEVVGIGRGNAKVFWGTLTGYSVQCKGCTGALYYPAYKSGKKRWLSVDMSNIYYNYKKASISSSLCSTCYYIMAADKKIPGGTVIDISLPYNSVLEKGTIRAIVLDVGSAIQGKTGDLLFVNDAATFREGRVRSVRFTIVRWGWWGS